MGRRTEIVFQFDEILRRSEAQMSTATDELASEIRALPDAEKLRLMDAILTDIDKPNPEIDRIWTEEAR